MIMVCAYSLARLDNFMIQNQLRIILINGTGEGLEDVDHVEKAEQLIQQEIRKGAHRDAPGICQCGLVSEKLTSS